MKNLLELWGGVECTVNRVGDEFFDQCRRSGHDRRMADLDMIAELGLRTIRYPVLWENVIPESPDEADWRWTDERLYYMLGLGLTPIVGLTHHGSGPRYTSLLDENFPTLFAKYARSVAERYPWVSSYTPVNEPNTTARFSGLYGHWYPHHRSDASYLKALVLQCKATVLALQEIRKVNPSAQLIQTEDMGKTYSTEALAYQAEFENDRRWLSFDLLCGGEALGPRMRKYLLDSGITQAELDWFEANPCPPDIIGINHYVTSERFLDHRIEHYPDWSIGGNGIHRYADVEAIRAHDEIGNVHRILHEAWERYKLPLAITEAHLGDPVDEQRKWLYERWLAADKCRQEGVDVRAVTVWALFGSFDWNTLVTRVSNHYEAGVFDVTTDPPSKTGLYDLAYELAHTTTAEAEHLDCNCHGWWNLPTRLVYGPRRFHIMQGRDGERRNEVA